MKRKSKAFTPVILFFIISNAFLLVFKGRMEEWGFDRNVVVIGNAILFAITGISYMMAQRGLSHTNPNVFFRAVYGSIMIKLFICMIAAFIYISMNKADLNKPALFTCMGLYLVYTFMEVAVLMKQLREKKHG